MNEQLELNLFPKNPITAEEFFSVFGESQAAAVLIDERKKEKPTEA